MYAGRLSIVANASAQMPVSFDAFFDFVAGPGCALILVVTSVTDLRILAALYSLNDGLQARGVDTALRTQAIIVRPLRCCKAVR